MRKHLSFLKVARFLALILSVLVILSSVSACTDTTVESSAKETSHASMPSEVPNQTTSPQYSSTTEEIITTEEAQTPNSPDGSETNETTQSIEATKEKETLPDNLEDLIPPTLNLGRDMTIFVGTLYYDEWLEKDEGDIVGTELYNRVPRIESNLGIELNVDTMFGDSNWRTEIISEVNKRQESTDPNMIADLCSTMSAFVGILTLDGRYQNIANSFMIDLDNPWWPQNIVEGSSIDGKVYTVSGDISPTLIYETYAIFYNTELIEQYNIENPITLVNNHQWTIDKLIEVTEGIYEDLNSIDKGPSSDDFFAFNFADDQHIKALPFGMGIRVIVPDEDEGYVWAESYTGEKMEIIADKVCAWIASNDGVVTQSDFGAPNYGRPFLQGQCIFNLGNFAFAAQQLAGSGINYGVVPCPLYDTEQEKYLSFYGNPTSFWGIPTNADLDNSATLLEYLAADAFVYITPALFERALKIKYVTGEVDGLTKMFDIIRDGLIFDPCIIYYHSISGTYKFFTELGGGGIDSWQSQFVGMTLKSMKQLSTKVVRVIRELKY